MRTGTGACLAAFLLCIASPLIAGSDCPYGPKGPGLVQADLVNDEGEIIGSLEAYNTAEILKFTLFPNGVDLTDIQLWLGPHITGLPVKKGKPDYKNFPYKDFVFNETDGSHQVIIYLLEDEDLGFAWRGMTHNWSFMLHGDFYTGDEHHGFRASGSCMFEEEEKYAYTQMLLYHPKRGHFQDAPVVGLVYRGPTQYGVTESGESEEGGGFLFFPGEDITFSIGSIELGTAAAVKRVSPLDLFSGADTDDLRVIGIAQTLQTLDEDSGSGQQDGKIVLLPEVVGCFEDIAGSSVDWGDPDGIDQLLFDTVATCQGAGGAELALVSAADAKGNLEAGLNESGIFRKNISKTEEWARPSKSWKSCRSTSPACAPTATRRSASTSTVTRSTTRRRGHGWACPTKSGAWVAILLPSRMRSPRLRGSRSMHRSR